MRNSINSVQKSPIAKSLPPLPATATPENHGRTIEVQTDLSMVTMEQYSQGYNSKAFMNKTHEFNTRDGQSHLDNISQMSPTAHIKYQNDLQPNGNQSVNISQKDF